MIATVGISNASKPAIRAETRAIRSTRAARSWMYSTAVIPLSGEATYPALRNRSCASAAARALSP